MERCKKGLDDTLLFAEDGQKMLSRHLSEDLEEVKENTMKISRGTAFRWQRKQHVQKSLVCLRNIREAKGAAVE